MKMALNVEVMTTLADLQKRIQKVNPDSCKKVSPLANQLLLDACKNLSDSHIERLAKFLIPQTVRKKQLAKRAERLVELYGEEYISLLEQRAERKKNNTNKINENTA